MPELPHVDTLPAQPEYVAVPDYHAVATIQFCELWNAGFIDFSKPEWEWDYYSEEQRDRVNLKIKNHFWYREIGTVPPGEWQNEFLRILNENMPKYKKLYELVDSEGFNLAQDSRTYEKYRNIYSEFPETLLSGNNDYISNGTDTERESVTEGSTIDKFIQVEQYYNDIDMMIINDLDRCFSHLLSVNLNVW